MSSPKILVVDDNPADLELVVEALSNAGYTLVTELSSRRAIKRFQDEGPWQVVISDLKMPGLDGLTLLKKIKACDPVTETIIITAHADTNSAIEALRLGAFSYLTKPLHKQELLHWVVRALERHRLTAEERRLIKELEERDARRSREIATIISIGDALSGMRAPTEIPDDLLRKIASALGAEGVALFLLDEARNELVLTANHGFPQAIADEVAQRGLPPAEGSLDHSVYSGEPILIEKDASMDPRAGTPAFRAAGVNSFLRVPLTSQQEVVGCLVALTPSGGVRAFSSEDREFLEAVGYLMGNAIQARKREQQARDAEKLAAVGELAAGIAHELGNALAVAHGAVQHLLANPGTTSPSRQYLEAIHRNVAAGDRIIKGLLSFARPSPPCLDVTDIQPILEQTCLLLKGEMAKAKIEVSRHYWPEPLRVFADAQQMQQVFLNILLNAIQAMPRGGTVTLRTFPEPSRPPWTGARVEIADTGAGIPAENLHRVFDPFFTTKEGGTGLGLPVSHRIVAAHGGELGVKSQEGCGTRFSVYLPVRPPASPPPAVGKARLSEGVRGSAERRRAGADGPAGRADGSDSATPPDHGRAA